MICACRSVIFYIAFLMIALFGLLNLVLALCFSKYKNHMEVAGYYVSLCMNLCVTEVVRDL